VLVERTRTVAAPAEAVWDLVGDPWMLPRWWPAVQRVEEVTGAAWTNVLRSPRGKTVRADYTRTEYLTGRLIAWQQELAESPFEAILEESTTTIELEPDGEGATRVALSTEQKLRGRYRAGGAFLLRRATRRQLDEALDGIERAVGA
jgi:uncharacterized protein YndB with AHSA1/START domain